MSDMFTRSSAIISPCQKYRYELRRIWNTKLPPFVIGMLNPSTANDSQDDPTIRLCIKRARHATCGSLIVWNLGAGRATEPADWMHMDDPIGPENDKHIYKVLRECKAQGGTPVIAWGTSGSFMNRDKMALRIASDAGVAPLCLGLTQHGFPKHPLYVPLSQIPVPYKPHK